MHMGKVSELLGIGFPARILWFMWWALGAALVRQALC